VYLLRTAAESITEKRRRQCKERYLEHKTSSCDLKKISYNMNDFVPDTLADEVFIETFIPT
jgi:hypothetical protein